MWPSTIALMAGNWAEPNGYRWARDYLLRMNIDLAMGMPRTNDVTGFSAVLPQTMTGAEVWERVRQIRTFTEQVRAYLVDSLDKAVEWIACNSSLEFPFYARDHGSQSSHRD